MQYASQAVCLMRMGDARACVAPDSGLMRATASGAKQPTRCSATAPALALWDALLVSAMLVAAYAKEEVAVAVDITRGLQMLPGPGV